jgi:peptidyl-prolyl cis-trans isomerase SurA
VLLVPKGSPPATTEARKREAEVLRERVRSCEAANSYFKAMQNGTIRDPITKTSADLPDPLRELLDKTPIGSLTPPEITRQGVEMVALCEKKATTVDSPKKRKIREEMFTEKYEAKQKAYLADIRKAAMIECR